MNIDISLNTHCKQPASTGSLIYDADSQILQKMVLSVAHYHAITRILFRWITGLSAQAAPGTSVYESDTGEFSNSIHQPYFIHAACHGAVTGDKVANARTGNRRGGYKAIHNKTY